MNPELVMQLKEVLKDVDPKQAKLLFKEATSVKNAADKFEDDLECVMRSVGKLSLQKAVKITREVHARVFEPNETNASKPPRKPNAFLEFVKEQLPEVKATQPYLGHHDRIRFIARMWNETKTNATAKVPAPARKRTKPT
jgi:hypothetical protein